MKKYPVLFNAQMVRAILDGIKTQTRRIVNPQPQMVADHATQPWVGPPEVLMKLLDDVGRSCPYGQPDDLLWVRETFRPVDDRKNGGEFWYDYRATPRFEYSAPAEWENDQSDPAALKWRPSIHMPRAVSRILLEIVSIRVERLRDISEADAKAEGTTASIIGSDLDHIKYRAGYQTLWESINGPGSWDVNPFVWVIEFRRMEPCAN